MKSFEFVSDGMQGIFGEKLLPLVLDESTIKLMKRLLFAALFFCCALTMSAQDGVIRVNYSGAKPAISDFARAYLFAPLENVEGEDLWVDEATNAVKEAWKRYQKGIPQPEGVTLSIDQKNGFVVYESKYQDDVVRVEMCYWNEADGQHKLFAWNVGLYRSGKKSMGQSDGISFYRYDDASKTMRLCEDPGFEQEFFSEDGALVSYTLPQTGKDITVTYWYEDGTRRQKTLKWDGKRFSF